MTSQTIRRPNRPTGPTYFRQAGVGDRTRYAFHDVECLAADCWAPGRYQHRGATSCGSRTTGAVTSCCLTRAYRGCPPDVTYDPATAKTRRAEGWRKV